MEKLEWWMKDFERHSNKDRPVKMLVGTKADVVRIR